MKPEETHSIPTTPPRRPLYREKAALVTLDGKAYYQGKRLLKLAGIPCVEAKPGDRLSPSVTFILTTEKERDRLKHTRILCIEELGEELAQAKLRLLERLLGCGERLLIGLDPGERTGLVCYYKSVEVHSEILPSVKRAVERVLSLVEACSSKSALVKVGYGDPRRAERMAKLLTSNSNLRLSVEFVDERGTSSKRGRRRDVEAARLIAFRSGRNFLEKG